MYLKYITLIERNFKELVKNPLIFVVFLIPVLMPIIIGKTIFKDNQVLEIISWVSFGISMAGVSIVALIVAEENEKKILNSIMLTQVTKYTYVNSNLIFGVVINYVICILITYVVKGNLSNLNIEYFSVLFLGSVMFCLIGFLIGISAPNQTAAEIIVSPIFIVLLLPTFFSTSSKAMHILNSFIPSKYFFNALRDSINGGTFNSYFDILLMMVLIVLLHLLCMKLVDKNYMNERR